MEFEAGDGDPLADSSTGGVGRVSDSSTGGVERVSVRPTCMPKAPRVDATTLRATKIPFFRG
eukprot:5250019-Pyramimonas_sp.AAC.1